MTGCGCCKLSENVLTMKPLLFHHTMSFRLTLLLIGLAVWPAQAQTAISGRVVERDGGGPLVDVRVALCTPDGARHTTWTDAQGRYALPKVPSGVWCIEAVYIEQDVGYVLQSPPIEAAGSALVVDFRMPTALREHLRHKLAPDDPNPKSLSTITGYLQEGIITDAEGTALSGSRNHFETYRTGILRGRVRRDDRPVADALVLLPETAWRTRTDAEGRFELTGLATGRHPLHIIHPPDTLKLSSVSIEQGLNLMNFSFRKETQD